MEKSKTKKQRRAEKPSLKVTGQLAMPENILPWEHDLLAVLLEAVDGSAEQEEQAYIEVPS